MEMGLSKKARRAPWLAAVLLVAACGGGGGDAASTATTAQECSVTGQKAWLRNYMSDWYFWSGSSPNPDPGGYSVADYFEALRYPGDGTVPADKWSYFGSAASHDLFYTEGRTLGYGLFYNGLEGTLPLKIRYVEPRSPAAAAGLVRGDEVLTVNGRSAAELVSSQDYGAFGAAVEGEVLTLQVSHDGVTRSVALVSAVYDLTPVSSTRVLELPSGAKAGYLALKDFITQAEAPLADAFAQFRAAGATQLILDLRYNGGGRVSTAKALASLVSGASHAGQVFTELRFSARHAASNTTFPLNAAPGPAFGRVVVLTGPRTCSASELVVNGLRPYAEVVTVGAATCGKPFGFIPRPYCGYTYSAVNFESVNGRGEGRYYDGLPPTCAVADDFSGSPGDAGEPLTAAALGYLATGTCPASAQRVQPLSAARRGAQQTIQEPGHRSGMWVD
jgi:carboxyl-terminal processing protease